MAYFIDLFSPATYERFSNSDRTISGFRQRQESIARRIHPGDKLICYLTKFSRWFGVLEVTSEYFVDNTPIFTTDNDPFTIRFHVRPICWLPVNRSIPIHNELIWNQLTFTRELLHHEASWTGMVRSSLYSLSNEDGMFLERAITDQENNEIEYPVDEREYQRLLRERVTRENGIVNVTVPEDTRTEPLITEVENTRESFQIQSKLAFIGEKLGFNIWLPRNDRGRVLQNWTPGNNNVLLDTLPLNYDEVTLHTIEQIDVLWLRRRSIVRAFEIEHTTSVYSGILRMADLLALQPNMDIDLHIVAPTSRRERVFQEIQRPVFSLLDKGPLSELCSFLTYESINLIAALPHLGHMTDSLIDEYEEFAD